MRQHSYPWWIVAITVFHLTWGNLLGLALIILTLDVIITDSYRLLPPGSEVSEFFPWIGVPLGIFVLITALIVAVNANTIAVEETGIRVKMFYLWWRQVLWTDIEDVITLRDAYIGAPRGQIIRMKTSQLTLAHRLLGLVLLSRCVPVVPVYPQIQHYYELMDTIRCHIKESEEAEAGEFHAP